MSAWRVVDCLGLEGRLSSARGQVIIRPDSGDSHVLPVKDVAVMLFGPKVSFSSAVMHRLLNADVVVLFCDWKGVPEGAAYKWSEHTRVGARQIAQATVSLPRRKNAWGRLVRAKVLGQAHNLRSEAPPEEGRLRALAKKVRSGDPDNIEAQAARLYWQHVFDAPLFRSPGDGLSGRNGCLDYGYAILRGFGIRAVLSAGLTPSLGVFHRGRSNPFNLVDDLIEPYRPAIDAVVARFAESATPDSREIKHSLVAAATQTFETDGAGIPASLARLAQAFGRYIEGDIDQLPVPVWEGSGTTDGRQEVPEW